MKFIDLFAGMGGLRMGFELACKDVGLHATCVFSSEIKKHAVDTYRANFGTTPHGDITSIPSEQIPDFDYLLAGFPCQAFSTAGKRDGFDDTRGTLFFEIERILRDKRPQGFLLENVEGLVDHPKKKPDAETGETLSIILSSLKRLGYKTTWKVLDSKNFGTPQKRRRIFIVGDLDKKTTLEQLPHTHCTLQRFLQSGIKTHQSPFKKTLLRHFSAHELIGKSIKDKRGGCNNIHSWDLELKGAISHSQKELMNQLLKQRRQKKWAKQIGITWMDGMPLTLKQISTFSKLNIHQLETDLKDLESKGYLKLEHPRELYTHPNGRKKRRPDPTKPMGYNIVTGKLSFELNCVLDPNSTINTIVATEANRLGVIDGNEVRSLTTVEYLRIFGFPDSYKHPVSDRQFYDLIGNTVTIPVVREVSKRLLS